MLALIIHLVVGARRCTISPVAAILLRIVRGPRVLEGEKAVGVINFSYVAPALNLVRLFTMGGKPGIDKIDCCSFFSLSFSFSLPLPPSSSSRPYSFFLPGPFFPVVEGEGRGFALNNVHVSPSPYVYLLFSGNGDLDAKKPLVYFLLLLLPMWRHPETAGVCSQHFFL